MAAVTCTRRIQFCAGHRVVGHENKCRNLHGHNYVAFLECSAAQLDAIGRVIDFACIKERIGGWIDQHWDHGMVLWEEDSQGWAALAAFGETKSFALPANPTAENMAEYLLTEVGPLCLAGTGVDLVSVRLWETENCYADVQRLPCE